MDTISKNDVFIVKNSIFIGILFAVSLFCSIFASVIRRLYSLLVSKLNV